RQTDPEPALRSIERAARLREELEDRRQKLGLDPHAFVADAHDHVVAVSLTDELDPPFRVGVLRRVSEQVLDDLHEADRIGVEPYLLARCREAELLIPRSNRGTDGVDGLREDFRELDALATKLDPSAHDPRDVEEVVDQPNEVVDLPLHELDRLVVAAPGIHREHFEPAA